MTHKSRRIVSIITLLFIAFMTMAAAGGWGGPLRQTGMGMPTETMQPQSTTSLATPRVQGTPTPLGSVPGSISPSPTMTSIFTGFTPYPTVMNAGSSSMGGCGSSCGTGGTTGMGAMGTMGTTITGTIGTAGMTGMGSMGAVGMEMSGCPMMSGSGMTGSAMGSMGTGTDLLMSGMDMSGSSMVAYEPEMDTTNPWMILGWVVLGLVSLAVISVVVFGVVLIIRHLRQTQPA